MDTVIRSDSTRFGWGGRRLRAAIVAVGLLAPLAVAMSVSGSAAAATTSYVRRRAQLLLPRLRRPGRRHRAQRRQGRTAHPHQMATVRPHHRTGDQPRPDQRHRNLGAHRLQPLRGTGRRRRGIRHRRLRATRPRQRLIPTQLGHHQELRRHLPPTAAQPRRTPTRRHPRHPLRRLPIHPDNPHTRARTDHPRPAPVPAFLRHGVRFVRHNSATARHCGPAQFEFCSCGASAPVGDSC